MGKEGAGSTVNKGSEEERLAVKLGLRIFDEARKRQVSLRQLQWAAEDPKAMEAFEVFIALLVQDAPNDSSGPELLLDRPLVVVPSLMPPPEEKKSQLLLPDGAIKACYSLEIGGKTADELVAELRAKGFKFSSFALYMMRKSEFSVSGKRGSIELVHVAVADLFGDQKHHTLPQIYEKAALYGLDLCLPEIGPCLRLKLIDQPFGELLRIAMKPIVSSDDYLRIFSVECQMDGLWLDRSLASPTRKFGPEDRFVFTLSK